MKIVNANVQIFENLEDPAVTGGILRKLEMIGRTCYKSETGKDTAGPFVRRLIKNGHEAMLEHASLTVLFTVDRGVSHEIVRHRLASYAQESTRFCNYSQDKFGNEITVIQPFYMKVGTPEWTAWFDSCEQAEKAYFAILDAARTPQEARAVLPTSLKTELWMTTNLREWRHFMKLRAAGTTGKPHPQMMEVAVPLLKTFRFYLPEVFDDIPLPDEEENHDRE